MIGPLARDIRCPLVIGPFVGETLPSGIFVLSGGQRALTMDVPPEIVREHLAAIDDLVEAMSIEPKDTP